MVGDIVGTPDDTHYTLAKAGLEADNTVYIHFPQYPLTPKQFLLTNKPVTETVA